MAFGYACRDAQEECRHGEAEQGDIGGAGFLRRKEDREGKPCRMARCVEHALGAGAPTGSEAPFLIDGPAVPGLAGWKALQAPLPTLFLHHALQHLVEEGALAACEMEPVAELLAGALQQAGLGIASADDPEAARERYGAGLDLIIDRLMRRHFD